MSHTREYSFAVVTKDDYLRMQQQSRKRNNNNIEALQATGYNVFSVGTSHNSSSEMLTSTDTEYCTTISSDSFDFFSFNDLKDYIHRLGCYIQRLEEKERERDQKDNERDRKLEVALKRVQELEENYKNYGTNSLRQFLSALING
ncbi:14251_t:CDS:1, partial [Dentiscutata erythropus]